MPDPTPQAIERFIERLVRGKIEDGQLSNSPLSLLDIDGICEAFSAVLSGVFHERIEYPTVQINAEGKAVAAPAAKPAASSPAQAKPVPQTTAPTPAVKAVPQTTGPNKPVPQTTAPVPAVPPVAQTTGPVAVVSDEAPASETPEAEEAKEEQA